MLIIPLYLDNSLRFFIFMGSHFVIHNDILHKFVIWVRLHTFKAFFLELDVHLEYFLLVNIIWIQSVDGYVDVLINKLRINLQSSSNMWIPGIHNTLFRKSTWHLTHGADLILVYSTLWQVFIVFLVIICIVLCFFHFL